MHTRVDRDIGAEFLHDMLNAERYVYVVQDRPRASREARGVAVLRGKTTKEYCERVKKKLDPLMEHDEILSETELEKKARQKGYTQNVKYPDCIWHYKSCEYIVVELKGGNFRRALEQLEDFAARFPEIHDRVRYYIIVLQNTKHLGNVRCLTGRIEQGCLAAVETGRQRIPLRVRKKPVYIRKLRL